MLEFYLHGSAPQQHQWKLCHHSPTVIWFWPSRTKYRAPAVPPHVQITSSYVVSRLPTSSPLEAQLQGAPNQVPDKQGPPLNQPLPCKALLVPPFPCKALLVQHLPCKALLVPPLPCKALLVPPLPCKALLVQPLLSLDGRCGGTISHIVEFTND